MGVQWVGKGVQRPRLRATQGWTRPCVFKACGDSSGCPGEGEHWAGKPEGSPGRTTVAAPSGYPSARWSPPELASVSPDVVQGTAATGSPVKERWSLTGASGSGRRSNKNSAQDHNKKSVQNCLDNGVHHRLEAARHSSAPRLHLSLIHISEPT